MNTPDELLTAPRRRSAMAAKASDLLPLCDFVSVLVAGSVSLRGSAIASLGLQDELIRLIWVAAAIAPFILYEQRFATFAAIGDRGPLLRGFVTRMMMFVGVVGTITYAGHGWDAAPRSWLALWLTGTLLICVTSRVLLARALRHLARQGALAESVAVVGTGRLADRMIPLLQKNASLFGVFDDPGRRITDCLHKPESSIEDLIARAGQHTLRDKPDRILIAVPATAERRLRALVKRLRPLGIPLELCPQHTGPACTVGHVGGSLPVTLLADRPIKQWNAVLKSIEDSVLSAVVLVLLLPVLACIALAIKLDSPGPVLFKQRRHGFNNSEFDIYKFRTMRAGPEGPGQALQQTVRGDSRITRVGRFLRKWSLDELPQVFNVLEGSMSLVGPRPHAVNMCTEDRLGHEIIGRYAHRHRVKPGITGWSQINGSRGATHTMQQLRRRVRLDLYYINHWSLGFDLKILTLTSKEVLRATNAF